MGGGKDCGKAGSGTGGRSVESEVMDWTGDMDEDNKGADRPCRHKRKWSPAL